MSKQTVADLLSHDQGGDTMELKKIPTSGTETGQTRVPELVTVIVVMDPRDVEVLDGKLIFEKRVLATSMLNAAHKAGVKFEGRLF